MRFSERLKVAQNIIARSGIDGVDLYAELARSEALLNGLDAEQGMMQPNMPQGASQESVGAPIMGQEGESTTQGEMMPPMA